MLFQWEITADEKTTVIIEIIFSLVALFSILLFAFIKKKFSKLTKKGYGLIFLGVVFFAIHILFDLLDTLTMKKVNGETSILYLIFDYSDAIFSFIGLFTIGFGFLQVAKYGMEVWEGAEK